MRPLRTLTELLRKLRASRKSRPLSPSPLDTVQQTLGYQFKDISLLRLALTHKSTASAEDRKGLLSNERLEFLGDAVLNCCVTEYLYKTHPDRSEGQLSKIKSLIVSRKILGEIGLSINLGHYLALGHGERESGGKNKLSIVSNAFEALIGALYLDAGLKPVADLLATRLFSQIDELLEEKDNINYKSRLLELSQRDGFGLPQYTVLATSGPEHNKVFRVQALIAGVALGEGSGPNKKLAQQNAAKTAIEVYEKSRILEHSQGARAHELVSH